MIEAQERRGRGRPKGAQTGTCIICRSPFRQPVEERLAIGRTFSAIIEEAERSGVQLSTTALRRHVEHSPGLVTTETLIPAELPKGGQPRKDLAVVVRDKVLKLAEDDKLDLTARDGLRAQELLDKREEHRTTREFQLNLARLLSGGGHSAPAEIIEGEAVDVTPFMSNPLLAPPELREPRE